MSVNKKQDPIMGTDAVVPVREDKHIYGKKGGLAPSYSGGQTSWLMRVVLLAIVVALGGVAWWGIELQKDLQASRKTLAEYDNVIGELRKQLSVTDESINQTTAQADDRLKELDFEIRKLWDNVWKRSRQRLDQNEANIKSLKNQQAAFLETINKQTELLASVDQNITDIAARFPQTELDAAEAKKATGSLISSIEGLRSDLKTIRSQQMSLAASTDEFDEWIESINGYRKQVNRKLADIEQELAAPTSASVPPATVQ